MMRVGLIDVDGHNFPNLCLMKISAYHKARGNDVEWCQPLEHYDIVYQSKVFDATYSPDIDWQPNADEIIKGGTGYGLDNKLPDDIEHIYPDYSLYPQYSDTAYGFLTRGCPRSCDFCIVSVKEGRVSRQVADLDEFWRGQQQIKLLDPNLLACKDVERLLKQLVDSKAHIDITQGLDIRLMRDEYVNALSHMRVKRLHFAWDNPRDNLVPLFRDFAAKYKRKSGKSVYVLTNFNSTHEEDIYRVKSLISFGYDPYVMIYDRKSAPKITRHLQRWCNAVPLRKSCTFAEYLKTKRYTGEEKR